MTEKKKELAKTQGSSVDSFIQQAIAQNLPVETMERLFSLREKVKQEQAREEFVRAMAEFQGECPVIKKNKKVLNKDGRSVRYEYASLDSIVTQVRKILAKNGLSYTIDVVQDGEQVKAVAKITHILGHSETSSFAIPVSKEGYMTEPQKYASSLTFAKRYALCNALGILTGDEDVDATDVAKESKPREVKSQILFLLRTLGVETNEKDTIAQEVEKRTKLKLVEENFQDIRDRLEVIVKEHNEDNSVSGS